MKDQKWINKDIENFFLSIIALRDINECKKYLRDLMTIQEIQTFASRWKVAQLIDKGETYESIEKSTGMSSSTIARISRWLEYGEGGYKLLLKRMRKRKHID